MTGQDCHQVLGQVFGQVFVVCRQVLQQFLRQQFEQVSKQGLHSMFKHELGQVFATSVE